MKKLYFLWLMSILLYGGVDSQLYPLTPYNKSSLGYHRPFPRFPKGPDDAWLGPYDGGSNNTGYLGGIQDVDTFLVWFEPPAVCSLIACEVKYVQLSGWYPNKLPITIFIARLDQSLNYPDDWEEYHGTGDTPGPLPIVDIIAEKTDSVTNFDEWDSDTLWIPESLRPETGKDIFGVGWVKAYGDSAPNPYVYINGDPPYHTLMHREGGDPMGWYSSYHFVYATALVRYFNRYLILCVDDLPNTFTTSLRDVYVYYHCVNVTMENLELEYQVNNGPINSATGSLISGDSISGYWKYSLPGVEVNDTVSYYVIATDNQGKAETTGVYTYIVKQPSGDWLYVKSDDWISLSSIPENWNNPPEVWVMETDGPPDSSVILYQWRDSTIVWKGWGNLHEWSQDYGSGICRTGDSVFVKSFLDRAGSRFWLVDQDLGVSLLPDLFEDYGTHDIPSGSWVNTYLGIKRFTEDAPLAQLDSFSVSGDSLDPVVGPLFDGVGNQRTGYLTIAPFANYGSGYNSSGSFDSLDTGCVVDMRGPDGEILSYRFYGVGAEGQSEVIVQCFNSDWIIDPYQPFNPPDSVTFDYQASDSLNVVYLDYLTSVGVPESRDFIYKQVKVGTPSRTVFSDFTTLRFFLPRKAYVKVKVLDVSGRVVNIIKDGTVKGGWNTVLWNARGYPSGTYFLSIYVNGKVRGNRKVVVLR